MHGLLITEIDIHDGPIGSIESIAVDLTAILTHLEKMFALIEDRFDRLDNCISNRRIA